MSANLQSDIFWVLISGQARIDRLGQCQTRRFAASCLLSLVFYNRYVDSRLGCASSISDLAREPDEVDELALFALGLPQLVNVTR